LEVVEDESALLRRVGETDIHPRALLSITKSEPDSDVEFTVKGRARSIPRDLAHKVWVTHQTPEGGGGPR